MEGYVRLEPIFRTLCPGKRNFDLLDTPNLTKEASIFGSYKSEKLQAFKKTKITVVKNNWRPMDKAYDFVCVSREKTA